MVTGPDRELFARPSSPHSLAASPPSVRGDGALDQDGPPPGVWATDRLCFNLVPERVLEHGIPAVHPNGITDVVAAVLFRPERRPAWLSDQKVIEAIHPNLAAHQVLWLAFRNDGKGWRYTNPSGLLSVGPTRLVDQK